MWTLVALVIIGTTACAGTQPNAEKGKRPLVGVIRWDGYNGSPQWTQEQEFGFLKPEKHHWRAPWFVRRTGNPDKPLRFNPDFDKEVIQAVTDREIGYAADAGIDYFAFCHFAKHKGGGWQLRENLEAYLKSPGKSRIGFSLICIGAHVGAGLDAREAVKRNAADLDWKAYVREYTALVADPAYQRVHNNRPLFYIFGPKDLSAQLGDKKRSVDRLRTAVAHLRKQFQRKSLGNPYIVGMNAGGIWSEKYIDEAGLDAVSAYRELLGNRQRHTLL